MTFMRPLINKIVGKRYKHYFFNRKSLILSNIKKNNLSTRIVSGSEIVYKSLVRNNVDHAFIYSGGSIMPIIDKFYNSSIN